MSQEGVIKFQLRHAPGAPLPEGELIEIDAWRRILFQLRLIGQDPARYQGFAYGNISRRLAAGRDSFVITGSQTGGLAQLRAEHYVLVQECRPEENLVIAEGPIRPSAESLTHGALYAADPTLNFVMHAHSPEIWRRATELAIPMTRPQAEYGSPQMAAEIARLREMGAFARNIFAMGGHEDGVVAFGRTAAEAAWPLVTLMAAALQLRNHEK